MDFHSLLLQSAHEEGFPLAGALDLDLADDIGAHVARYDVWLDKGYDGAMSYLRRGRDRRADPKIVFPEAESILCVAIPYPAPPAGEMDPKLGPRYARYLRRRDYHEDIAERLERVMKAVEARLALEPASEAAPKLSWKVCVDTSAVLERSWSALAGLGWIGKNSLLIHPQYGSYLFLAEVLLNRKTGQGPKPLPNYCGGCTRCLDACPTGALVRESAAEKPMVDSNRCIAYWTLEKRGALEITNEQKSAIGTWIAGCDICQEVCPFNTKAAKAQIQADAPGATDLKSWRALLEETHEQYQARTHDSSLSRVKPAQFSRNLAISLTNAIEKTEDRGWLKELTPLIQMRLENEADPDAKAEWLRCQSAIRMP